MIVYKYSILHNTHAISTARLHLIGISTSGPLEVTSLLTRMAADGEVPAMPTPTYGKIMSLADQAYGGIREVQGAICVQPPYVYVQTIAMLVNAPGMMMPRSIIIDIIYDVYYIYM